MLGTNRYYVIINNILIVLFFTSNNHGVVKSHKGQWPQLVLPHIFIQTLKTQSKNLSCWYIDTIIRTTYSHFNVNFWLNHKFSYSLSMQIYCFILGRNDFEWWLLLTSGECSALSLYFVHGRPPKLLLLNLN